LQALKILLKPLFVVMKSKILFFLSFFVIAIITSCGGDSNTDNETQEVAQNMPPNDPPPEGPDVNSPTYWDDATIVWQDEFDGTGLSSSHWTYETGAHGWGNNEWQNYIANDNVEVSDGTLKITAEKVGTGQKVGDYTSVRLNSTESFTYGRMEIRAKIPEHKGNGIWPALWMLGSNIGTAGWPACGEIDLMEYVSFDPNTVHFTIHSNANNHVAGTQVSSGPVNLETIEEEFHNYGVLWTSEYLKFYIDEIENIQLIFQKPTNSNLDNWPFSQSFYFLMNIAVGGNWGGLQGVDDSIFPATMEVDYVRVYQVN
jgi:beta-glucanase (GH16 family)